MDLEKISVIVPVYNVEKYVEKCVNSLCEQTYTNIEIVLVDDGSTDSSGILCDRLKNKDDRIVVIHKQNGGLSDARNQGVEKATADSVVFVDSDDYVDKDYVLSLVRLKEKFMADVSCTPLIFEYEGGKQKPTSQFEEKCVSYEEMIDIVFRAQYSLGVSACSKLFPISALKKHPFPVGEYHEDMVTIRDILAECKGIVIGPRTMYHYVQRRTSITHAMVDYESMFSGINFLKKCINETNNKKNRQSYIHRLFGLVESYCRVMQIRDNEDKIRRMQRYLKQYLLSFLADNKTSLYDKSKGILIAANKYSLSLFQRLLKSRDKKRNKKTLSFEVK